MNKNASPGCDYFQNAVAVEPDYQNNIKVKSCCRQHINHESAKFMQSINANYSESAIQNLLDHNIKNVATRNYNQLKQTECVKCFQNEQAWPRRADASQRLRASQIFTKTVPGELNHIDISFSKFCNHACRYCGPDLSSLWAKDFDQAKLENYKGLETIDNRYSTKHNYQQELVNTINIEKQMLSMIKRTDISKLNTIFIKGGEPFIVRVLDDFLDYIIENANAENIHIMFNTNGSVFPKQSTLNKIMKFKSVELRLSVEAVGSLAEYIRHGMNWQLFTSNIQKWKELDKQHNKISLWIAGTVNIYSINKLAEFQKWYMDQNIKIRTGMVYFGFTDFRKLLTTSQIDILYNRYQTLHNDDLKTLIMQYLTLQQQRSEYSHDAVQEFKNITNWLDKTRNQNLKTVNYELYQWLYRD